MAYFKERGHAVVKSSSLIPRDDPTLLFTNAGMVQFKRTFLGEEKRDFVRAATSQKCVRAGGKHNDLENVGYTGRHHTFFEMLGNFSFGDYFKDLAIDFAWDLMTRVYGLPADRLWVSVYLEDDDAHRLWEKNTEISEDRIVRLGKKDNFWSMGDTGPCGPCSEILIDQGEAVGCHRPDCKVGCDCDRYLELWNLVFMEFNRDASGAMAPLPKPSIDTGMGLERIAAVLQGAPTNYGTDLFMPIIKEIETLSGTTFGRSEKKDVSIKVVADHSRAATFLVGDGVLPSNEGRGYVLRRILRRAMRYGRNLGLTQPFLFRTAGKVAQAMEEAYPELLEAEAFIKNMIKGEEERFLGTLETGLSVLEEALNELRAKGASLVPGDLIFKMYDTYGFPIDIIQDVVREDGLTLDLAGFEASMDEQRVRSRSAWKGSGAQEMEAAYRELAGRGGRSEFVGYDASGTDGQVLLLVRDGKAVEKAFEGDSIEMVTNRTPLYGEAGGQAGDCGWITGTDFEMEVVDTIKTPADIVVSKGNVLRGTVSTGDTVTLKVDTARRAAIARNHTATHLLHAVLREVVGDHVKQSGSLVAPDRLRFDFTHFSALDAETLERIENQVNKKIRENAVLEVEEMDAEKAFNSGAMALFEEKYGDRVRVVGIGDFSKELCGGTHTERTGDIGFFKIVSESSVAAGVRRIEALTGEGAVNRAQQAFHTLITLADMVKAKPEHLVEKIEKLLSDGKAQEKKVADLKARLLAQSSAPDALVQPKDVNGVKVLVQEVPAEKPAQLRDLADQHKGKLKSGIIVLGSKADKKVMLIAVVTDDLLQRYHAGDIIKELAAMVGGGGGGRSDMAQAGGSKPEKLSEALAAVPDIIGKK